MDTPETQAQSAPEIVKPQEEPPQNASPALQDAPGSTLFTAVVLSAVKPDKLTLWNDINQVPKLIITARSLYAQGYSLKHIAKKLKRQISVLQTWQDRDPIDWNTLRRNYHAEATANSLYQAQKSSLEQVARIQEKVDAIMEEAEMLPWKSKGEAIRTALELDDRRRLILGEDTSKSVNITLTTLIKAEREARKVVDAEFEILPAEDNKDAD